MHNDSKISRYFELYREAGKVWATSSPAWSRRCCVSSSRRKPLVRRWVLSVYVGELILNLMRQATHFSLYTLSSQYLLTYFQTLLEIFLFFCALPTLEEARKVLVDTMTASVAEASGENMSVVVGEKKPNAIKMKERRAEILSHI